MKIVRSIDPVEATLRLCFTLALCALFCATAGCNELGGSPEVDHTIRVRIPENVAVMDLNQPSVETRRMLDEALRNELRRSGAQQSDVIVLVDENGHAILPDAEEAHRRRFFQNDVAVFDVASNELSFTFDSPELPWLPEELTAVRQWAGACYEEIRRLYGPPAFPNHVNIRKIPVNQGSGYYTASINEITLGRISGAVICHEIVHAFHDDFLLGPSSWEEGMARAVEVEACRRAGIPSANAHDYYYDIFYEELNHPVVGAWQGNIFAGWSQVLLRYQLAGYAWAKAMIEDNEFLTNFNRSFYESAVEDLSIRSNTAALSELAAAAKPTVENVPFPTWYSNQHVLNTEPPTGDLIYLRATGINNLVAILLNRQISGIERDLVGVKVDWLAADHLGGIFASGSGITSDCGWVKIYSPELIGAWVNSGYVGRVKITASATVGETRLVTTAYSKSSPGSGVFGVVVGEETGSITFTPLDAGTTPVSVDVGNGVFEAEELLPVKGRIQYVFTDIRGVSTEPVVFTKDDTPYFIRVDLCNQTGCGAPDGCHEPGCGDSENNNQLFTK